jgi:hypothetical protein
MKMSNWNINIQRVLEWMQTTKNDITQEAVAINAILGLAEGVTDEDTLGTYWVSIRSIGGSVEDFPKARVGHAPSLPEEVYMNVDSVMNHISSVFASAFDEIVAQVILPRGQTARHETAADFGNAMADKAKGVLEKAYKAERWDGTLSESGVPTVALVEKEETTE